MHKEEGDREDIGATRRTECTYPSSNPITHLVLGTSCRLMWSSAECSDHAKLPFIAARVMKASGEGPTVLILILD